MFEIFKANFIGNSDIAREAEILNPEDIILNEEKKNNDSRDIRPFRSNGRSHFR